VRKLLIVVGPFAEESLLVLPSGQNRTDPAEAARSRPLGPEARTRRAGASADRATIAPTSAQRENCRTTCPRASLADELAPRRPQLLLRKCGCTGLKPREVLM